LDFQSIEPLLPTIHFGRVERFKRVSNVMPLRGIFGVAELASMLLQNCLIID
jgi:hypothetical protein